MEKINKRGGAGRNQGRKPLSESDATKRISASVTEQQHAKYHRLGASEWVRRQIDEAKEPG